MRRSIALATILLGLVAACGDTVADGTTTSSPTADTTSTAPQTDPTSTTAPDRTATSLPEKVPEEEFTLPTGPVPTDAIPEDLLADIKADAASRANVAEADLVPVRAEEALWNDGSLGCPKPGQVYTQAVVDGYWVIFQVGDDLLDYRASKQGFFIYCDNPFPGVGGPPTG